MRKQFYKCLLFITVLITGTQMAQAQQKIGTNPGTLDQSAVLELGSADVANSKKGFLGPRVSLVNTTTWSLGPAGATAVAGMMVYNTATTGDVVPGYYVWQNAKWNLIQAGAATTTNGLANTGTAAAPILTSTVNGVAANYTLPIASTTVSGLLSNTDFATFNAKESTLTFSNGLIRSGNAIKLGGALTANTTITNGAFDMNFSGTGKLNAPSGGIGLPANTRRGIAVNWNVALGDVSGMEQASFAQTGNQTALRLFAGSNIIAFGAYTDSTNFSESGRFRNGNLGLGTINPLNKLHVVGTNPLKLEGLQTITPASTDSVLVFSGAGGVIKKALLSSAVSSGVTAGNGLTETAGLVELGGSLTKATNFTLGTNNATFDASGTGKLIVSGAAGNTSGLRLSNLTGAGTAGAAGQKVLSVDASGNVVLVTDFGAAATTTTNALTNTGTAAAPTLTSTVNGVAAAITLPTASATNTGLLSNTDFATFNAKESTLTFSNGLIRSGNEIKLGGTLIDTTLINAGSQKLDFRSSNGVTMSHMSNASATKPFFLNFERYNNTATALAAGSGIGQIAFRGSAGGTTMLEGAYIRAEVDSAFTATRSSTKLQFGTTPRGSMTPVERMRIEASGDIVLSSLAGTGSRMVVAGTSGLLSTATIPTSIITSVTNGNGLALTSGVLALTGSNVTAGSNKISLGGTPTGAALKPFSVDVNESNLALANIGGTLPLAKLTTGTTGQILQVVGTTPAWVTPTTANSQNIYTADGTLAGARNVNQSTFNLNFSGTGKTIVGSIISGSTTHAGRLAAVTGSNATPSLSIMNDSTSKSGNEASIVFRTQGSASNYGNNAKIVAVQTSDPVPYTALSFNTFGGSSVTEKMRIAGDGVVTVSNLAGSGSRMVVASASGVLSTQTIPAGTVTSVGLTAPSIFTTGSAITSSGNLTLGLATQAPNLVWAGPASGTAAAVPSFRALGLADLNAISTTVDASKFLQVNASGNPVWASPDNIYYNDGALLTDRTVTFNNNTLNFKTASGGGGVVNSLSFDRGAEYNAGGTPTSSIVRIAATDTLEFQIGDPSFAGAMNRNVLTLMPTTGFVSIGSYGNGTTAANRPKPTSTLDVNGSTSHSIKTITAATTLGASDYTVIANATTAGFAITLPAPSTCSGRVYKIRKNDETSNAITFTFSGITGSNAIKISESSYISSLNYLKTLTIQSDGTNWQLVD